MSNLFNKNLEDLKYSDIQQLVDNKVPESLFLDYKKGFDFENANKSDDQRKQEIAKDITGLANSKGGYLIYGIKETNDGKNIPEKIVGIGSKKGNQNVVDWLNQIINNGGVIPKVHYFSKMIEIPGSEEIILILEIDESLNKPHMVLYNDACCYYARFGTETKKTDHLQVKTMFEFKDKYLLEFNNVRKKLNLDKDIDENDFGVSFLNKKLISFGEGNPIISFTLVPYNLNRNINFNKDKFYSNYISDIMDESKYYPFNYLLNKKLNHFGMTFSDYSRNIKRSCNFNLHIYKNGIIEFSSDKGFWFHNPETENNPAVEFIKYKEVILFLKNFLIVSKNILNYLDIREFNLNITFLKVGNYKLSYENFYSDYQNVVEKIDLKNLYFEYDLSTDNLIEEKLKITLLDFSDDLLSTFGIDCSPIVLQEFDNIFEND